MTLYDPFGPEAHALHSPEHSNRWGHYCYEWDGLWVCIDCEEIYPCGCFDNEEFRLERDKKVEEMEKDRKPLTGKEF